MIGQTLSHYRVTAKLGAGGMGEVYRAHDTKLKRSVALKVLPPALLSDPSSRARLLKEARAAAGLNHPNVCTIYEVGEAEGQVYIAMELVEGETLSARLAGGALPVEPVLRYGTQIADALAHAHARQIVHRDLKCANVMITPDGRAKVLDFGLATRLADGELDEATRSHVAETEPGAVVGTLAYMAPEQLRAEPATERTDLWALGVVLYEAATGHRPFRGHTGFEVSSAILREPPSGLPPSVPIGLGTVIVRCLEKEPGRRYQQAGEVRAALEALSSAPARPADGVAARDGRRAGRRPWRAGLALAAVCVVALAFAAGSLREWLGRSSTPRIESLAVLPLKNLMGDPAQDYFVEGLHEALTAELSKVSALKVISRTSSMRYKDTVRTIPEIARELGVEGLIEGSVLREGNEVRVSVQLIHGPTDRHVWADSYQRDLRGILALQSDVARAIAAEIRIAVTPSEEARLATVRQVNPEAHDAYLQGRFHWNRRTETAVRRALDQFQRAIDLDPGYPLAWVGLSDAYNILGFYGDLPPRESFPRGKAAAGRALELDPALGEAYTSLAYATFYYDWDAPAAEALFRKAIELNPSYAVARHWHGNLLSREGRVNEGMAEFKRAQQLDPLAVIIRAVEGWAAYRARAYDQSIDLSRRALELDPGFALARLWLSWSLQMTGQCPEAVQQVEEATRLAGGTPYYLASLGYVYGACGRIREAGDVMRQLDEQSSTRYVSPYYRAEIAIGLGRADEAVTWLERALEDRANLLVFAGTEPRLDPLRGNPRFQTVLRQIGERAGSERD